MLRTYKCANCGFITRKHAGLWITCKRCEGFAGFVVNEVAATPTEETEVLYADNTVFARAAKESKGLIKK